MSLSAPECFSGTVTVDTTKTQTPIYLHSRVLPLLMINSVGTATYGLKIMVKDANPNAGMIKVDFSKNS